MYSKELIRGTLRPIILKLLSEHRKMYGYEICQKIREETEGQLEIREGSLYPALYKLKDEGLVTVEAVLVGHRTRQYYSLAKAGRIAAKEQVKEFTQFLNTMGFLFEGQPRTAK